MTSTEGSRLVRFASAHPVLQVLIVAGLMLQCSSALRLLKVKAPPTVLYGGVAKLDCQYDLESDSLYAAKWFKDGHEFYRYRPGVGVTTFPVQGVTVNNSESIGAAVYLHNLTLQSSGLYNCEISAESPSFQTVIGVKQINVIALPRHGPRIEGARRRYRAAETVSLNCTSGKSKPAPVLRWFVNGALVTDSKSQSDLTTVKHDDGFETVSRRLQFVVTEDLFDRNEDIKVKCEVSVPNVYVMSDEKVLLEKPQDSVVEIRDLDDDCLAKIISFITRLWMRENDGED
nr:cell adhesion molecule 1-like [Dermacentor andersoni]